MKLSKTVLFIFLTLILVGGVSVGYLGIKSQKNSVREAVKVTRTATSTPLINSIIGNATTIEDIDTTNWKTFIASNGSFSYKYPPVGVKLNRDTAQPSYMQFSDEQPTEEEGANAVFN